VVDERVGFAILTAAMRILVIGGGGREHALAWKLSHDSARPKLFCAPGNAGTARLATNVAMGAEDIGGLLSWAKENRPDLTVVGPEAPLCAGVVDAFEREGLPVFGPSSAAAQIEGSKIFAKEIMQAGGVPTARFGRFTDANEARNYVREQGAPIVVKAEGLAAGKGVYVCGTVEDADRAIDEIMVQKILGRAGERVIVEECLAGEEASILALVDGKTVVMLASAQDHKRVFDGDRGPNTGGMGAYSPAPVVTDSLWPVIRTEVFERTLAELGRRGIVYRGVLYAGLMLTDQGPKVLEFNCRFGDPETQAIIPRIRGDLIPALQACVDGSLRSELIRWRDEACVCVVMAAGGYPGGYEKGKTIEGLDAASAMNDVMVFHAGTRAEAGSTVTAGGRVLGVTALGKSIRAAARRAYNGVSSIRFEGAQYRKDIAARAMKGKEKAR
jgi:phosphoribosylamine--glycine ligase